MFSGTASYQLVGVNAPFGLVQADATGLLVHPGTYSFNYGSWAVPDPTPVAPPQTKVSLPTILKAQAAKIFQGVRLYVDPLPMLIASNSDALAGYIDQVLVAVDDLTSSGQYVVVDFHVQYSDPFNGIQSTVPGWGSGDIIDGPDGPKFTALIAAGSAMATALIPYGANVAFELFNEPAASTFFVSPFEPWPTQLYAYWTAVREAAPDLSLIVSGADAGDLTTLTSTLVPANFDSNTAFSIHVYEPAVFALQNIFAEDPYYIHGLPFPPPSQVVPKPLTTPKQEIAKMVAAAVNSIDTYPADQRAAILHGLRTSIQTYFSTPQDATWVQTNLQTVITWATAHSVTPNRIFLGEFGCPGYVQGTVVNTVGADLQSRTNHVKAYVAAANTLGISLSCHVLNDPLGGYTLTDNNQAFLPELSWAFGGNA